MGAKQENAPRPSPLDPRPSLPTLGPRPLFYRLAAGQLVLALPLPSGYNNMRQHEAARVVAR